MIIVGTRGVTYSAGDGTFRCPTCHADRAYKQKRVRRFFTLYFIPIVPLDLMGEYVECSECNGTWHTDVLNLITDGRGGEAEAEFQLAIRHVMLMMMLSDGEMKDDELATVARIYKLLSDQAIDPEIIRKEALEIRTSGQTVEGYLKRVAGYLNDSGKEMIIKAAFHVAVADGSLHDEEAALLQRTAAVLELSPAHLRGILSDLTGSHDSEALPESSEKSIH